MWFVLFYGQNLIVTSYFLVFSDFMIKKNKPLRCLSQTLVFRVDFDNENTTIALWVCDFMLCTGRKPRKCEKRNERYQMNIQLDDKLKKINRPPKVYYSQKRT